MVKQMSELGIKAKFMGGDGMQTPNFIKLAGNAAEGAMASMPGLPKDQMPGGAKFLGTSVNMPMPFANVSSGGYTNSAGVYSYPGGTVTSTLAGQYVRITDNCGAMRGPLPTQEERRKLIEEVA